MQKINLSSSKKAEIYEYIIKNANKKNHFKPVLFATIICIFILLGTLATVYAEEIKDTIVNIFTSNVTRKIDKEKKKTEFYSNSIVKINYDADIPETEQYDTKNPTYTYQELETKLGIPFLKSDFIGLEEISISYVKKQEGKIAEARFSVANYKNGERPVERCWISFSLLTKYADQDLLKKSRHRAQGNFENAEYYIHSLNTMAYIIKSDNVFTAIFDYKGVQYTLRFQNRQMYETLEDEIKETYEKGIAILDSLYL